VRFSLKALLLLVTVVAILLAVQQIHRRNLLQAVENFKREGVKLEGKDTWADFFWLQPPDVARIPIRRLVFGESPQLEHAISNRYASELRELRDKLTALGVRKVELIVQTSRGVSAYDGHDKQFDGLVKYYSTWWYSR
jgi:hypothetical protein